MSLETYTHMFEPGARERALVLFHGTGDTKEGIARLGRYVAPGAALLALDGDVSEGGMQRFFRRRAEGVYDMDDLAARTAALDAFLAAALPEYGIDGAGAAGLGYSNGANILANLYLTGRRPFARAVLMHPLIPFDTAPMPDLDGISVLITAGRRDPICPADLTERLAGALAEAGASVETVWHQGGHEMAESELAAVRTFLGPGPGLSPGGAG